MTSQTNKSFTSCWKLQFIEDKSKQKNTCSEQWSPGNSVFRIMGTFGNQIVWLQNNIYWHAYNSVSLSSYDCFWKTIFFVMFTVNIYMTISYRCEGLFYIIQLHILLLILKVEIFYSCGWWHHIQLTLLPPLTSDNRFVWRAMHATSLGPTVASQNFGMWVNLLWTACSAALSPDWTSQVCSNLNWEVESEMIPGGGSSSGEIWIQDQKVQSWD
jgi:hypothetical protein